MAATHTYVVSKATAVQNIATVTGTVDTIPSTGAISIIVTVSYGDILAITASGGAPALVPFIAPVMLQAAINAGLPVPAPMTITQLPTGSFSLGGHTYVISSVTAIGDVATVVGTVDGTAVTITTSASGLSATLAKGVAAVQALAASQMLPAAIAAGLTPPVATQLATGTFTL